MEYKLIASDLDETLLNDDHVVPESNIYWIQKAVKERGVSLYQQQEEVICRSYLNLHS